MTISPFFKLGHFSITGLCGWVTDWAYPVDVQGWKILVNRISLTQHAI
jgi:hypothetical protein